jgi:hypothetical protein
MQASLTELAFKRVGFEVEHTQVRRIFELLNSFEPMTSLLYNFDWFAVL